MRVLGVDPGLTRCGLGVVDGRLGRARMVAVGVVRTPSDGDPGERLDFLEREMEGWLDRYRPVVVADVRGFADSNITNVMSTAHATAAPYRGWRSSGDSLSAWLQASSAARGIFSSRRSVATAIQSGSRWEARSHASSKALRAASGCPA